MLSIRDLLTLSAGTSAPTGTDTCRSWDEVQRLIIPAMPEPQPGGSEAYRDELIRRINDPDYGLHVNPGRPPSMDVISRLGFCVASDGRRIAFQSADVTGAADGDHPRKTFQLIEDYRPGATWQRVIEDRRRPAPVTDQRIGPLVVNGLGWTLNGHPWQWRGCTAFDLPVRLEYGDVRFLDWAAAAGFSLVRVAAYTVQRMPRSPGDGLSMLPRAIQACADRGLAVEIVALCDTADLSMDTNEMRAIVSDVGLIADNFSGCVVEIANEIGHASQVPELANPAFLRELRSLIPAHVPVSVGSSHGHQPPQWDHGDYVTHHSQRTWTDANGQRQNVPPEHNAAIMGAYQRSVGKPVVDDEPIGCDEVAQLGRRVNDPDWFARQARAAKVEGIGTTFHPEAGLSATMPFLGPVHQESARRFVTEIRG